MNQQELIEQYAAGPQLLRDAVAEMTEEQLDAAPVAGKWSTRQVICHIADFEPVYLDRIKRVIAEEEPTFSGGDPDLFAARLAYQQRSLDVELQLIQSIRAHLTSILSTLASEDFQRIGNHSVNGPMTLERLLQAITGHIPHHIEFIQEKRQAMSS